eukprot:Nk52_evm24s32 gene=Nk52_evmTU24s32
MGGGTRREDPAGYDPMRDDPVCNPMDNFGSESLKREEEGTFRILAKDSPLNHKLSTLNGSEVGEVVDIMMKSETGGDCCRAIGAPPYVPRKTSNSSVEEVPISVMAKFVFNQDEELIEKDTHFEGHIVVSNELLNLYYLRFDQIQINFVNTTAPDNIYAVVEESMLGFTNVKRLGRLLQNNFAQVKVLTLVFYEVYEEFEFERDMVADLVELESLSVRVVVQSGRYARLRRLKKIPNFVFSSEDGVVKKKTKLRELSIDIPYADISEWHIDDYMINLTNVELNVGIPPIPQGNDNYIRSPWRSMSLVVFNVRATLCGNDSERRDVNVLSSTGSTGTSIYFQALCDGIKKYGTSPFDWENVTSLHLHAGDCSVPALIDEGCAILLDSLESLERLSVTGFAVNGDFVNAVGRAKKLEVVSLLKVEWGYFEKPLYIPMGKKVVISMSKNPMQANLELIAKKGPITLDLSFLCLYPCDLDIDGGGYFGKHPNYVKIIGSSNVYRKQAKFSKARRYRVGLSNVKIDDTASDLLMRHILHELSAFSVKYVDLKDVLKVFPCSANTIHHRECVGNMYTKLTSLQIIGNDQRVVCDSGMPHVNIQWLTSIPHLSDLRVENACVTGFEHSSFSGTLHLINNGLKEEIPSSFVDHLNEVVLSSNRVQNGVQYLKNFWGVVFNVSGNNISEFDATQFVIGSDSKSYLGHIYRWFGLSDLDISHNFLNRFELDLYKVMLMFYAYKVVNSINLSSNKLKSIQLQHDLPPLNAQEYRNLTVEYDHCGYEAIGKSIVENVTLSVDISQNEFTVLEKLSFNNLRSMQFLNASHSKIKTLEPHFFSGNTCRNPNGCYVDLQHNEIGVNQDLSLYELSERSCISYLDLSYNVIQNVPSGLGSLIGKCVEVYRDYGEPFALPYAESEGDRFGKRSYIHVNLNHNNITKFDYSFCDGLNESYVNTVFGERRRQKLFIYLDLSHNNLAHIGEKAFDCKAAFLLLNINHNPISTLPGLVSDRNYPLVLLSAANTSITKIPESFNNPETLFSLKSVYISGKMDWSCCELLRLSPMNNSTSHLLRLNPDDFEDVDLLVFLEANSYAPASSKLSISSVACTYTPEGQYFTFEEFKASKWMLDRKICANIDRETHSDGNTFVFFTLIVSSLCMLYLIIAVLVLPIVGWGPREYDTGHDFTSIGFFSQDGFSRYTGEWKTHYEYYEKPNFDIEMPNFDIEMESSNYTNTSQDDTNTNYPGSVYEDFLGEASHLVKGDAEYSSTYMIVYTFVNLSPVYQSHKTNVDI